MGHVEIRWGKEGSRAIPVFTKDMFTDAALNGPGNWKKHVLPLLKSSNPIHWNVESGIAQGVSEFVWTMTSIRGRAHDERKAPS